MGKSDEESKKDDGIDLSSVMPENRVTSQYKSAEQRFNIRVNQVATQKTMLQNARATALQLNNVYDNAFDSAVQKMMNVKTPEWMQLASAEINKVADIPKNYLGTKVENTAQKFMSTPTGQKIAKKIEESMIKTYGKAAAKTMAKKIPIACLAIGMECAKERWNNGDYIGAGFEGLSALTANIPGIGTAVSSIVDAGLAASDCIASLVGTEEQKTVLLSITKEDEEKARKNDPYAKMKEQNPEQYEHLQNQVLTNPIMNGWAKLATPEKVEQAEEIARKEIENDTALNRYMKAHLLNKMKER